MRFPVRQEDRQADSLEVNLSHNFIDDQAAPSLVELGSLSSEEALIFLQSLRVCGNSKVLESFQQLLCYNSNFTYLDLLGNPLATPFHVKLYAKEILGQAASAATLETMIEKFDAKNKNDQNNFKIYWFLPFVCLFFQRFLLRRYQL